jgi:hypothetical protein
MDVVARDGDTIANVIPRRSRIALQLVGLASWLAGCLSAFVGDDGAGTVSLVAAGAFALLMGLVGRWPQRVGVSGSEVAWDQVTATVTSAISVSEQDPTDSPTEELRDLLHRLEQLRLTGTAPAHPAVLYDQALEAAIRRLLPRAVLRPAPTRSRAVPDFTLWIDDCALELETKWRQHPTRPLSGSTLPELADALPSDAILVVVANALDVSAGQEVLDEVMPSRASIITWRDVRDDDALAVALRTALDRAALASGREPPTTPSTTSGS